MNKTEYRKYLKSFEWKWRRQEALNRAANKCQICSYSGPLLDIHHNSYARFGEESPTDLVVLCSNCHQHFHKRMKDSKDYILDMSEEAQAERAKEEAQKKAELFKQIRVRKDWRNGENGEDLY